MKYLISTPHSKEECLKTLDELAGSDILDKTELGCGDGDHTAYTMVEAEHRAGALAQLPASMRQNAKAIGLSKYTKDEIRALHTEPAAATVS